MKEFRVTRSAQLVALMLGVAAAFVLAAPVSARVMDKDMESLVAPAGQDPGPGPSHSLRSAHPSPGGPFFWHPAIRPG